MTNNGIIVDTTGDTYISGTANSYGLYIDGGDDYFQVHSGGVNILDIDAYLGNIYKEISAGESNYLYGDSTYLIDLTNVTDSGEGSFGFGIVNGTDNFEIIKKTTNQLNLSSYIYDCSINSSNSMTQGSDGIFHLYGSSLGITNTVIGSFTPTSLVDIEITGTAKVITNILEITNKYNAADMDGTGSSILFNQWYYDAETPAVADIARIVVGTETDWTSTASSQDGYMVFETALDGVVGEKLRISSNGDCTGVRNITSNGTHPIYIRSSSSDILSAYTQQISFSTTGDLYLSAASGRYTMLSNVVGIGTTDLDGTPAIGKLTIKGTTNDGSTYPLMLRDSDEANVSWVDTNGKATFNGGWTDGTATSLAGALTEVASITNAARDLNVVLTGDYSHVVDIAGCTNASDGFSVKCGTDQIDCIRVGANAMSINIDAFTIEMDSATTISVTGTNFTVSSDGDLTLSGDIVKITTPKTPASASATGTIGQICWDTSYIYVCVATDTWKRAAIATWV